MGGGRLQNDGKDNRKLEGQGAERELPEAGAWASRWLRERLHFQGAFEPFSPAAIIAAAVAAAAAVVIVGASMAQ